MIAQAVPQRGMPSSTPPLNPQPSPPQLSPPLSSPPRPGTKGRAPVLQRLSMCNGRVHQEHGTIEQACPSKKQDRGHEGRPVLSVRTLSPGALSLPSVFAATLQTEVGR